ncbi:MAG: LysM peptidoglycan-binding domain-containing protein [Methylococcales bacterium]
MRGNRDFLILLATLLGFVIETMHSARADSGHPTIEELYQKLEQRDTLIFDLQQRVEQLEKRVIETPAVTTEAGTQIITVKPGDYLRQIARQVYGDAQKWQLIYNANRSQLPHPDAVKTGMKLIIPAGGVILAAERDKPVLKDKAAPVKKAEKKEESGKKDTQAKQTSTKTSETNNASAANTQTMAAPGQFEVDEEAAERALERTLVQEGALLLLYGQIEFQPSFTYTRSENDQAIFVNTIDEEGNESDDLITKRKVRRDILNTSFAVRAGLPFDSQLELSIPYQYVDGSRISELPADVIRNEEKNSDSGQGDIRVGLAKTLLREDGWWPDIIGRVTWDSATGEDDIGGLSNGFHEAIGSLTFIKRQDPLVFIGSAGYQKVFEKDDFKSGDQLDFSIGVVLAASPETSLSFFLNQSFVNESETGNRKIQGSDQHLGTLSIGASSIIGRGIFVNLSTDIGLTDDASDYSVGLSMTKRFNWLSHF